MFKLFVFCLLLVVCWPAALVALMLYPVVWLLLLPLRLVGVVVGSGFALVGAVLRLPVRVLRAV